MEEGWSGVAAAAVAAVGSTELCSEFWLTLHQTAKTYEAKHQQAYREAETGHLEITSRDVPENTQNRCELCHVVNTQN